MGSVKKSAFSIIRKPRITEKGALVGSHGNCVVFEVHPRANKLEIRRAVEQVFDVKVKAVRTVNYQGKTKSVRQKQGRKPDWKKAYVQLHEGSSIDVIEGL